MTDVTFGDAVLKADSLVLVEFWAPWARDCGQAEPPLRMAADALGARVRLVRLNVEQNPVAAVVYGVQRIPTVLLFRDGRDIDRWSRALAARDIVERVQAAIEGSESGH